MSVITEKALLTNLAVSQWTARKLDRKETDELAKRHGAVHDAARVNKALLPMAGPLDKIHKKTGEIRSYVYTNTLPWAVDGSRILPAANYIDFASHVRQMLAEWDQLVQTFVGMYPALQAEAQALLNGLYKPEDYPPASAVAAKFKASVSFFPVPSENDFRASFNAEEDERLREELREQLALAQTKAARDCWERLYDVAKHAADKLSDPKAIFRDSLVENAQEICRLLPKLNITDDSQLETMRQEVEKHLCSHVPDVLRLPGPTREGVAQAMREVAKNIAAVLGDDAPAVVQTAPVAAPVPVPEPTKSDAAQKLNDIFAKMGAFYGT